MIYKYPVANWYFLKLDLDYIYVLVISKCTSCQHCFKQPKIFYVLFLIARIMVVLVQKK